MSFKTAFKTGQYFSAGNFQHSIFICSSCNTTSLMVFFSDLHTCNGTRLLRMCLSHMQSCDPSLASYKCSTLPQQNVRDLDLAAVWPAQAECVLRKRIPALSEAPPTAARLFVSLWSPESTPSTQQNTPSEAQWEPSGLVIENNVHGFPWVSCLRQDRNLCPSLCLDARVCICTSTWSRVQPGGNMHSWLSHLG